jgi:gamma-glutamylaminecyclotransferase
MKPNSRVFVYGTLREGEVNHYLLDGAAYCGPHVTAPHFKMLHLGAYPGVVGKGSTAISGEVYHVDSRLMSALDRLEGYPHAYKRKLIPTPWGRAWIYLYRGSRNHRPLISSGQWKERIHRRRWFR